MIKAHRQRDGSWRIELAPTEKVVLKRIADAYGLPQQEALIAIIFRGMESIGRQVEQADSGKTLKQLWKEKFGRGRL